MIKSSKFFSPGTKEVDDFWKINRFVAFACTSSIGACTSSIGVQEGFVSFARPSFIGVPKVIETIVWTL
jgi:hypothetical protein